MPTYGIAFVVAAAAAACAVALGVHRAHRPATDAADYLRELDLDQVDPGDYEAHLQKPFLTRVVRPLAEHAFQSISKLTPANYLDSVHKKLLLAGLTGTVRAEEFVTAQLALTGVMTGIAVAMVSLLHPPTNKAVLYLVILPAMGALFPISWLNRKVSERK